MSLSFGPFQLIPARRLLLQGEASVPIGSRALDILIALVEQRGSLVTKEQLLAVAWPTTNVHEANLRVHIGGIRKLLGDGQAGIRYVLSEAGRGYRFVAPVLATDEAPPTLVEKANDNEQSRAAEPIRANLTPVIGRAKVVDVLAEQLQRRRFITIVGPGGIGKTTVALAVAERVARPNKSEICFVDLAPLSDRNLVYNQLIASLGIQAADNKIAALAAYLQDKEILIVFDNCEHVIDAVTPLAEGALSRSSKVKILATSREPLRAEGEFVHRLTPLGLPDHGSALRADQAMAFPAIQLFVERARATLDDFEITDADAQTLVGICRKLDGLPLAIELAAARLEAFGIQGLASLLNDRLSLPTLGRRTAAPRHRTLASLLDWSYETLPELERLILRRLSVFAGTFSLDAASVVAADAKTSSSAVVECVANLVEKSLVSADISNTNIAYRLLDTTRVYALQKLRDSQEFGPVSRRHAEYYRKLFEDSVGERERNPADWLASHRGELDSVRTALDWAFMEDGDVEVGVALTLAAIFLWTHLSLNQECCVRVRCALSRVAVNEENARIRMQLQAALAGALGFVRNAASEKEAAWSAVLAIAEKLGDPEFHLRGLWGLWSCKVEGGHFRAMQGLARSFATLAAKSGVATDMLVSDRMLGLSAHFLGQHEEARRRFERVLAHHKPDPTYITRFRFDPRILVSAYLAVELWLLGLPDQSMRLIETCVDEAEGGGHAQSLMMALTQSACPIALANGSLAAAEHFTKMLRERSLQHGVEIWGTMARYYEGMLLFNRGEWIVGTMRAEDALNELPINAFRQRYLPLYGEVADALNSVGHTERALRVVETALELGLRDEELWIMPELLRVRGEIAAKGGATEEAEAFFNQSIEMARRHKALSWELRSATSLARLQFDQGRSEEGYGHLSRIYGRFTEGFDTYDLRAAKDLLGLLR